MRIPGLPLHLEWIGSIAAFCTTVAFVPQMWRVWLRKSARDISLLMFLLFSFGVVCWLVYGIGLKSLPMIVANGTTLVLAIVILGMKMVFDRKASASGGSHRAR